jgi:LysM repeat protein/ribosomal protein L12E/L44/L45/RPP1/RPP2
MKIYEIDNKHSLINYVREDIYDSYKMKVCLENLDEGFFRPWSRYLEEAQLRPGQPEEIFKQIQAQLQKSPDGSNNSTVLGNVVSRVLPDSMVQKLSASLPEPDPQAKNDPNFVKKATVSIEKLNVDQQTKQGLAKVVSAGAKNPAAQAVILSLLGGVLGGILSRATPFVQTIFPGGGTLAMGAIGAIVAGTVAVAAGKIQGKGWKESFKGAIKPALAGAAGAVVGSLAREFLGSPGTATAAEPTATAPTNTEYTIKPGDTLSQIAADNDVSIKDIMDANPNITDPNKISSGQEIVIPSATGNTTYQDGVGAGGPGSQSQQTGNLGQGLKVPASETPPPASEPDSEKPSTEKPAASTSTAGDFVYDPVTGEMVPSDSEIGKAIKAGERTAVNDSYVPLAKKISEGQVYIMMRKISACNNQLLAEGYLVVEGPMDMLKKAGSFLKNKAQNLTQRVTADKLTSAWKDNGSPMDSVDIANFLRAQGVNDKVIDSVYKQMNIADATPSATADDETTTSTGTTGSGDQDTDADDTSTDSEEPAATPTPAEPKGPKAGDELQMPGTDLKYKFTPQWLDDQGKPAPDAVVKVLTQLASGVDKSDIEMGDLRAARRSVGLMASKLIPGKTLDEVIGKARR